MLQASDRCDKRHQMSTNEGLQTQNSTGDPAVLYTSRPSQVQATGHRASVLQRDAEILDHPASSLGISSASRRHGASCESRDCRGTTATCSECRGRTFAAPCSERGSCGHRTTVGGRRLLDAGAVERHNAAAASPELPDRVPGNHAGHTETLTSLHPRQCCHHIHHHL